MVKIVSLITPKLWNPVTLFQYSSYLTSQQLLRLLTTLFLTFLKHSSSLLGYHPPYASTLMVLLFYFRGWCCFFRPLNFWIPQGLLLGSLLLLYTLSLGNFFCMLKISRFMFPVRVNVSSFPHGCLKGVPQIPVSRSNSQEPLEYQTTKVFEEWFITLHKN